MPTEAPIHQRAFYEIKVSGLDITAAITPVLLSIALRRQVDEVATAIVRLDDKSKLPLPAARSEITISLGWPEGNSILVFKGVVNDVVSEGQKHGGRTLSIVAHSVDWQSPVKTPQQWNLGDGTTDVTLKDALEKSAQGASVTITVDPELGAKTRKFFMSNNESFLNFGARMGDEFGGKLITAVTTAKFIKAGVPIGASIKAVAGEGGNLLAWNIAPWVSRTAWQKTGTTWFDAAKAKWMLAQDEVPGGPNFLGVLAQFTAVSPNSTKESAEQQAAADAQNSDFQTRGGWLVIDGEPNADVTGTVEISGARPGVDGNWYMTEVDHEYHSAGGFTTRIEVQPIFGAGQ